VIYAGVLEDAPEEAFGGRDKWATLGAVLLVAEEVSDDFRRTRAEVLGPEK
jgi:hypothetical protein